MIINNLLRFSRVPILGKGNIPENTPRVADNSQLTQKQIMIEPVSGHRYHLCSLCDLEIHEI